jgi:plasmid stability protein
MASITIRNLDDQLKQRLRMRAAERGRSMEEEAREILQGTLKPSSGSGAELYAAIRADVEPVGGIRLEPLLREPARDPPFTGPAWDDLHDE